MNREEKIKAVATALGLASLAAQAVLKIVQHNSPAHRMLTENVRGLRAEREDSIAVIRQLNQAIERMYGRMQTAEAKASDLAEDLQRALDGRKKVLARNTALKEQEERDVALILDLARNLGDEAVFGTEYAGRWKFTARHGERLYRPMDEANFPRGHQTIWAIRRMMDWGTRIAEPKNLNEAMGNTAAALNSMGQAIGKALYGEPEGRPDRSSGGGDPGRGSSADSGHLSAGDGTGPGAVEPGGEGYPGKVSPSGQGGDRGDGR